MSITIMKTYQKYPIIFSLQPMLLFNMSTIILVWRLSQKYPIIFSPAAKVAAGFVLYGAGLASYTLVCLLTASQLIQIQKQVYCKCSIHMSPHFSSAQRRHMNIVETTKIGKLKTFYSYSGRYSVLRQIWTQFLEFATSNDVLRTVMSRSSATNASG